jgi:hypothetical protein
MGDVLHSLKKKLHFPNSEKESRKLSQLEEHSPYEDGSHSAKESVQVQGPVLQFNILTFMVRICFTPHLVDFEGVILCVEVFMMQRIPHRVHTKFCF